MVDPVQVLVIGILVSSFYALLSMGLALVYAIADIENLAHGSYVMLGAYASFLTVNHLGVHPAVGMLSAVLVGAVVALLTWKILVEPIRENSVAVFMVTLILALAIEMAVALVFGREPRLFRPVVEGTVDILGVRVAWNLIIAFGFSWAILGGLWAVLTYTYLGKGILAVAQNQRAAELAGVNAGRIYLVVWILSGAFAGLVGVFYGVWSSFEPGMWMFPLIYAFSIVIVGGLGSLKGTMVAAHIIGLLEALTLQIEPRYRGVPALLALLLIMMIRPQGLFGRGGEHP